MANAEDLLDLVDFFGNAASQAGEVAQALPGFNAYARAFCRVAAGTPGATALSALNVGTICDPFWAEDGITPPAQGPPFQGGQCPGTSYGIVLTWEENGPRSTSRALGNGPHGLEVVPTVGTGMIDGELFYNIRSPDGFSYRTTPTRITNLQFNVRPTFPDADDSCGDPGDGFIPSPDAPGDYFGEPQTINGPDGNPYEVTPFDIGVDVDGNIEAPFNIDGVDFGFGPGSGGGLNPGPTTEGLPIMGNGGEGGRGVPEAPAGSRCVAIAFTISGFAAGEGEVAGSAPNRRRYRVFGNAAVEVAADSGGVYYQANVDLVSERVVEAIAVEGLRIVGFKVNLEPGLTYTATPIYRADSE